MGTDRAVKDKELEAEIVIVGGGGAGLAKALQQQVKNGIVHLLSGSALGFAINSGRIAGENAVKFIKGVAADTYN